MPIKQDNAPIQDAMEQGVKDLLNSLIDGSIKDLDGPIRETAQLMTLAARRNRPDLVTEAQEQLMLIMLEKEYMLKSGTSAFFDTFLTLGVNLLVNGAVAGITSLKVV